MASHRRSPISCARSTASSTRPYERRLLAPTHKHTRTYDYEARLPGPATMMSMTGLEYLHAVLRGDMPAVPIAYTLDFWPTEFAYGRAVFEGEPQRHSYNPLGTVHGGWAATILDSALGCAVHSTLPAGKGYTSVDLSITLIRAITENVKRLRSEATILHAGGSVAAAHARITDDAGTLYATGTTTCLTHPHAALRKSRPSPGPNPRFWRVASASLDRSVWR